MAPFPSFSCLSDVGVAIETLRTVVGSMGPGLNYKYYIIFVRTLDTAPVFAYITICRTYIQTSALFTSYDRVRDLAQCPCP